MPLARCAVCTIKWNSESTSVNTFNNLFATRIDVKFYAVMLFERSVNGRTWTVVAFIVSTSSCIYNLLNYNNQF